MAMVDPIMLLMMAAASDPTRMGPMLDALGPDFSPERIIPGFEGMLNQFRQPTTSGVTPGTTFSGNDVSMGTGVPGVSVGLPPPGMDMGGGDDPFLRLLAGAGAPPPTVTPPTVQPPVPLTRTPPPNVPPQVRPPTAPSPIMSGGVAGAQKAPEIGLQPSAGGTPAQILLAALMGGRNMPNPLRVPTLGALLGGAT